jgi:hypothetical protein
MNTSFAEPKSKFLSVQSIARSETKSPSFAEPKSKFLSVTDLWREAADVVLEACGGFRV